MDNSVVKPYSVNLFIPCEMDMFNPSIAFSVMQVLEKIGEQVFYCPEQTCCGRRFYYEGDLESARELGNKMMKDLNAHLPIVAPTTSCVGYIRNYYPKLFENTGVPAEIKQFTKNIYELSDFIVSHRGITKLNNFFNHRVFYFKSCAARNVYRLGDEPEILLRNTEGLDLLTDPSLNVCCSADRQFSIENPEVSEAMLKHLVDKIYTMGAQFVTSTDIHCLQHIEAYIQANNVGLEVIHIADILNAEHHV